jgi:putative transposase
LRGKGIAVESVCRVLREQGYGIAARTYRAWKTRKPSARAISDQKVLEAIKSLAWTTDTHGHERLTLEGLYGRRKMLEALRQTGLEATPGAVDRAMRKLGLNGTRSRRTSRTVYPTAGETTNELLADSVKNFSLSPDGRTSLSSF